MEIGPDSFFRWCQRDGLVPKSTVEGCVLPLVSHMTVFHLTCSLLFGCFDLTHALVKNGPLKKFCTRVVHTQECSDMVAERWSR